MGMVPIRSQCTTINLQVMHAIHLRPFGAWHCKCLEAEVRKIPYRLVIGASRAPRTVNELQIVRGSQRRRNGYNFTF